MLTPLKVIVLAFIVLAGSNITAHAQQAQNVWATQILDSGRLYYSFTYDLIASHSNIPSHVRVKIKTSDSKVFYISEAKGDVGNLIYPGAKKIVRWDFQKELVHFSGDMDYEIEVVPNVKAIPNVKRGRDLTVQLSDIYTKGKTYAIKLYRKEEEIVRLNDMMLLENSFKITIPSKTKTRGDYQLVITDGEQQFFSNTFKVKPKVNRVWFVLAAVAVAVPVYILATKPEVVTPLPGAPEFD